MQNETRNILLYIQQLKKEVEKEKIKNENIDFCINEIIERIKIQLENEEKEAKYNLEKININKELLNIIKEEK